MKDAVLVCGLGVHPPDDATLETLQALEGCGTVFSDLADRRHFEWLKGLFPRLKPVKSPAAILRAAGRGAGLAVWGHPQYTSLLARRVEEIGRASCRERSAAQS